MVSMENFSEWLLEELKKRNWSQSDLSRMAGISPGTISNVISGAKGLGYETGKAIAHAFKIPPEEIFRVAGILPPKPNADEWLEEMNHKLSLLDPATRLIAEKLINALLEETPSPIGSLP
jgi:transcriptional regulator with XRE-family HTH domain